MFSDSAFNDLSEKDQTTIINTFFNGAIKANLFSNKLDVVKDIVHDMGLFDTKQSNELLTAMVKNILLALVGSHNKNPSEENVAEAMELLDGYDLLDNDRPTEIRETIIRTAQEYHNALMKKYDYESAQRIRTHYKLFDRNVIVDSLTVGSTAALEFLEEEINKGEFDVVKDVINEYNLTKEQFKPLAQRLLKKNLTNNNFEVAIQIVRRFKLSVSEPELQTLAKQLFDDAIVKQLYEQAAFNAWERHLKYGRYDKALEVRHQHKIPKKMTEPAVREAYKYNLSVNPGLARKIRDDYRLDLSF